MKQELTRPQRAVAIGGSTGAIPVLGTILAQLPADFPAAVLAVIHVGPDGKDLLSQIFARGCALPVATAEDGLEVKPGHVYVAPAGHHLLVLGGCIRLGRGPRENLSRPAIDPLFRSVALEYGSGAVGIVLSGMLNDGAAGLVAIRQCGGVTVVQNPADSVPGDGRPRDPGMPESAIACGVVDMAVPVEEMGGHVLAYSRSFAALATISGKASHMEQARQDELRNEICDLLRRQTGHDFSGYKTKTFMRRVGRRMHVLQKARLEDYVGALKENPDEVIHLFRDLLINVTNFFRDPEAFEALERLVIPKLFQDRGPGDTVRVWVPAAPRGKRSIRSPS